MKDKTGDYPTTIPIIGRARVCLELIKSLNLKGKTLVDIGSSFGWLEKELEDMGVDLIGVDPDPASVKFARKNLGSRAKFIVGSVLKIPLKSESCDIVTLLDVIEHVPRKAELVALAEINRILKKGGYLLLSTPNTHPLINLLDPAWYFGHRHYGREKIAGLIKKSGFKITYHSVRGNLLNPIHTNWFYLTKLLFGVKQPRNKLIESISDYGYNIENGFFEHFILAIKIDK